MPKLSIVIPSYNHARYIEATLQSLADQSFRDFEIVVIDDGSVDHSVELIQRFAKTSELPVIVSTQANAGAHAAINAGIDKASGDHIAILNSDDLFHPDRFSLMMAAAPATGDYLAFSEFQFIDGSGNLIPDDPHNIWYREILGVHELMPSLGYTLIRSNLAVSTSNFLFSRSLFAKVGPFRPYRTAHDLDFLLRCVPHVEPIFLRRPLLSYRIHPKNTINLNRDVERREVRTIYDDYLRSVTQSAPTNERAPGSRTMPLYSELFLVEREHWSGPHPTGALLDDLTNVLRACPVSEDARALRLEVRRLTEDLARMNAVQGALNHTRELLADAERNLSQARMDETRALDQLNALQRSASWKWTKPIRRLTRACRRLVQPRG